MKTFLLDTSAISSLIDEFHEKHHSMEGFVTGLDPERDKLYVCPVVLGEIEYGNRVAFEKDVARQERIREELRKCEIVDIDKHTVEAYGEIRSRLFQRYAPKVIRNGVRKVKSGIQVEDLMDSTPGKSLGIQENDLWIVACAVQHNMSFVTSDKMTHLRQIVLQDLSIKMDWRTIK